MQWSDDAVARPIGAVSRESDGRVADQRAKRLAGWRGPGARIALVALLLSPSTALAADRTVDDVVESGFAAVIDGRYETYVDYLLAEAARLDPVALFILGSMCENGTFGARDPKRAVRYYLRSAELGYAKAQIAVADLYRSSPDQAGHAIDWYRRAAAQEDAEALRKLGLAYMLGQGVAKDIDRAIEWFTMAARRDDALAKRYLGHIYRNGIDVPKNAREALGWYRGAARDGDDVSQYFYGLMVATGDATLKNAEEGKIWLLRAAHRNNVKAMLALGLLFLDEDGGGKQRDVMQAYRWISLAAARGSLEAAGKKSALARELTPEQLREVEAGDEFAGTFPALEIRAADRR